MCSRVGSRCPGSHATKSKRQLAGRSYQHVLVCPCYSQHGGTQDGGRSLVPRIKNRASVTLNSIGDAVLSTEVSGNVTYLNDVAEQMTGWSWVDAQAKPLTEGFHIIAGATRESSRNPMDLAIQTGSPVGLRANCILIRRDQTEIPLKTPPLRSTIGRVRLPEP
jgi:PAS domain-containing protein